VAARRRRIATSCHNLGKTLLKMPDGVKINEPTAVDLQVCIRTTSGFELTNGQ